MFSVLRFILIVGAIFYYSPVRQGSGAPASLEALLGRKSESGSKAPAPAADTSVDRLETLWQALPNGAKQAVIDKVLTTSGLSAAGSKPADTLLPTDRQLAPKADAAKPRP
jgi:hypothetical protein